MVDGGLEYFKNPELKISWGGPFNGQEFRKKIFLNLLDNFSFKAVVETGTYRGTTTDFFLSTSRPVYTTESQYRYFGYALIRFLSKWKHIRLFRKDSRDFLRSLAARRSFPKKNVFFYLDAHWQEDLPLVEELDIIVSNWRNSVIMIDDFCVPDTNYGYDNYGEGRVLKLDYLNPVIIPNNIPLFFPSVGSEEETGEKRGCIVLGTENDTGSILDRIPTLRRYYI